MDFVLWRSDVPEKKNARRDGEESIVVSTTSQPTTSHHAAAIDTASRHLVYAIDSQRSSRAQGPVRAQGVAMENSTEAASAGQEWHWGELHGASSSVNPVWLPLGDLQLSALIVELLKSHGLFASFHWDCLADMHTKPACQNLRQKVDNFMSTSLDKQEWNPAMNKNQLQNGLRQSMVQSGMLEAGVDRIISQVVDPKLNHMFRPQIEKAIHKFPPAKT
uniref:biorientation of chromosomes in cell division protein 1-like n=1 Tax=Arvicanthis niloticus TaxID=61156 RepID=UPI001486281A|nr:biorientation of chromosomes in cell division protein 1-like [Arvicanthis niloticus]